MQTTPTYTQKIRGKITTQGVLFREKGKCLSRCFVITQVKIS